MDTLRREHGQRLLSLLSACWGKATAGDTDAIRTAARLLDSIARLHGLEAAVQIRMRAGIDAQTFAEQAAELLRATGVGPLVEAALPALEPAEREAWLAPERATGDDFDDDDDEEPWCNIEPDSVYAAPTPALGTTPHPAAESPPVINPEGENDDQDADDDAPDEYEPEVVEAEVVAEVIRLPPSQRRVPASEVIDENGVPLSRTGYAPRLGRCDPLAHWRR